VNPPEIPEDIFDIETLPRLSRMTLWKNPFSSFSKKAKKKGKKKKGKKRR
jgi:hypothetical protein